MAYDLIKTILEQAGNYTAKLEQFSQLNILLQERNSNWWGLGAYRGGMGDAYGDVLPFLIFSDADTEVITEINAQQLFDYAQKASETKDKKRIYIAGICFALVAVYGQKDELKEKAYQQLKNFAVSPLLQDDWIFRRCANYLQRISLDGGFYPTVFFIRSWDLTFQNKENVLDFEEQRQIAIQGSQTSISIGQALKLLGLDHGTLTEEKIRTTANQCNTKLRELSGLTPRDVRNPEHRYYRLFQFFKEAAEHLVTFIRFKNFDRQFHFSELNFLITEASQQPFAAKKCFNLVNKELRLLEQELKIIETVKVEPPYVSVRMIEERLGNDDYFFLTSAKTQLKNETEKYWQYLLEKNESLVLEARALAFGFISTQKELHQVKLLLQLIEEASIIFSEVKGSATEETYILSEVATSIDEQLGTLSFYAEKLRGKINQYHDLIHSNVQATIRVLRDLTTPSGTIGYEYLIKSPEILTKIEQRLAWLIKLEPQTQDLAEIEFSKVILSQTSLEEVVPAVAEELLKVAKPLLEKALRQYWGSQYNPKRSLVDTLSMFFKEKKGNLQEIIPSFIGEIKSLIKDQTAEDVNISAKKIKIESISLTIKTVIESLQDYQKQLIGLVKQLNTELIDTLPNIIKKYKQAIQTGQQIIMEKNSLCFSWEHSVSNLLKLKQELEASVRVQLPKDPSNAQYIDGATLTLINDLDKQKQELDKVLLEINVQTRKGGLASLRYLILKSKIKKEKQQYLAQVPHHQERLDSLQRLMEEIEKIDGTNLEDRFSQLLTAVTNEKIKTTISHQKIGFLGSHRACRLEKMYRKILNQASALDGNATPILANLSLNPNRLQYEMLKDVLEQNIRMYLKQGAHHVDRYYSIIQLRNKIKDLDGSLETNCFQKLLTAIQEEKGETHHSHIKIGFFGNWHSCRLEKMYADVINQAQEIYHVRPVEDEEICSTMSL